MQIKAKIRNKKQGLQNPVKITEVSTGWIRIALLIIKKKKDTYYNSQLGMNTQILKIRQKLRDTHINIW